MRYYENFLLFIVFQRHVKLAKQEKVLNYPWRKIVLTMTIFGWKSLKTTSLLPSVKVNISQFAYTAGYYLCQSKFTMHIPIIKNKFPCTKYLHKYYYLKQWITKHSKWDIMWWVHDIQRIIKQLDILCVTFKASKIKFRIVETIWQILSYSNSKE